MSWWWNTYAYTDSDSDGYSDTYSYSDRDGYDYTDAQTDAYAEVCANAKASPHTPTKTIG